MKLQDYLHYYMGCRVMAAPYGGQQKRLEEGKLIGINVHDIAHVKLNNWQSVADISISCVKPILRRLEDMTEKEKTEIFGPDILWFKPFDSSDACDIPQWHKLLQHHFDLFGLIDAGLAVIKTITL